MADRPTAAHGLSEPGGIIEARIGAAPRPPVDGGADQGEGRLRILLGAEAADGWYAQHADDPGVFVLPPAVASLAQRWLLDRSALMVDPNAVTEVLLTSQNGSRTLRVEQTGQELENTLKDLKAHPVWEFVEEVRAPDETWVRPVVDLPATNLTNRLVATPLRSPSGSTI